MKLPRSIQEWEQLSPERETQVEVATELAIAVLDKAGYGPTEPDSEGEQVCDNLQGVLMDAILRGPKLAAWLQAQVTA
jgi:hypothetical protein